MSSAQELWLSLCLSTPVGSVAILRHALTPGVKLLRACTLPSDGQHLGSLIPTIQQVLRDTNLGLDQIQRFVTDRGPGSFTGLRIAYATLKAFCRATGARLETLDGHEAQALDAAKHTGPPLLNVVTQMTRSRYWVSQYAPTLEGVELLKQGLFDQGPDSEPPVSDCAPLTAEMLAIALTRARSRQTIDGTTPKGQAELAEASPNYFGSRVWNKSPSLHFSAGQPDQKT